MFSVDVMFIRGGLRSVRDLLVCEEIAIVCEAGVESPLRHQELKSCLANSYISNYTYELLPIQSNS